VSSHMNTRNILSARVKHDKALVQHQKALEVFVAVGYEHPDVAVSKENICLLFKAMGKKSEAKQMFTEAKHTVTEPGSSKTFTACARVLLSCWVTPYRVTSANVLDGALRYQLLQCGTSPC
jgi:hypothetical protein